MTQDDIYDSRLKPYLISILLHGFLLVGLMLVYKTKPLPTVITTEASLVGQEDLAQIQAQISQAHQALHQPTTKKISPPKATVSSDYDQRMAEKERLYQEQMKQYAQDLDRAIASDLQLQQQALDELDRERMQAVNELKNRQKTNEQLARQQTQTPKPTQEPQTQPDRTVEKSLSEGQSTQTTATGKTAKSTQGSSATQGSSNQAQSSIASRVQAIWERYENPKNRYLIATIIIDDQGNLKSVRFGAGDKELQPSLEASIKEASPFYEMKGISTTFTIRFFTD